MNTAQTIERLRFALASWNAPIDRPYVWRATPEEMWMIFREITRNIHTEEISPAEYAELVEMKKYILFYLHDSF